MVHSSISAIKFNSFNFKVHMIFYCHNSACIRLHRYDAFIQRVWGWWKYKWTRREKKANTYRRHIYVFHTKRTSAGICMHVSHFGGGKRYKHASRSHMQRNCVKYLFYSKLLIFITFVTEKGNRILSECTHKMFIRRHIGARYKECHSERSCKWERNV